VNPSPPGRRTSPATLFHTFPFQSLPFLFLSLPFPSLPFSSFVLACLGLSWLDFLSQLGPNLAPKIHQNPLKIDAKMPSHLDSIFGSIFHRFLPPTSTPRTLKNHIPPKEKRRFFKKSLFAIGIDF
jgi:hypothetical protein